MESFSRAARRVVLTVCLLTGFAWPALAQTVSDLGAAQSFTVLGGSAVTSTGLTIVNGDLGVSPGTSITGFPPGLVINGIIFNNVAPATTAHADTITAYNLLAGAPMTTNLTSLDLGGMTLAPGVYKFDTSAGLTGILTLDNTSNPTGAYVFQIGSTLTTATNSAVIQIGGSNPNIFWQVGSSATIGTGTDFLGNILALTSITMDPGASLSIGRALSINGAVTMSGGNSMNLNAPGALPLPSVGAFWNGSVDNTWSGALNWSPDATGAVKGTLTPGADVVFSVTGIVPQNQNTQLDINALISSLTVNDPAGVSISGLNTLTILGAAGATSTLTVNSGAGLTTINSDVVLGGLSQVITVDNSAGLVINGVVRGILGLTKEGVGTMTLTGANTYTGGTLINTGTVAVGDFSGLQSSTALGMGSVVNHGILETTATTIPFSPAVKINVAGDYTQSGPGSALQLQVVINQGPVTTQAAAGLSYDTLAATGDVSVDGSLRLNFETGSTAGQRFQLISTSGLNAVTNPGAFVAATVTGTTLTPITTYNNSFGGTYAENNVVVTLYQSFATYGGLTPNQTSVAENVDRFVTGGFANNVGNIQNSAGAQDFFNNIVTGLSESANTGSLGRSLNELSPQRLEILRNVAFDNYAFEVQSLDDHLARVRNGQDGFDTSGMVFYDNALGSQLSLVKSRLLAWSPSFDDNLMADTMQPALGGVLRPDPTDPKDIRYEEPVKRWNGFIDGGAELGDLEDNQDMEKASYTTGRVRGGVDYRVTPNFRVGALMGYSHTDVELDNEGSKAKVESYTPGLYMAYADKEGFYANGLFTYTRNEYKTERKIVLPGVDRTASGSPGGNQFGINADGGYEFHRGDWTFGPNVGLTYVNLGIDSFSESGADSANLNINSQSVDSLRSRVGGTVRYKAKVGTVALIPHMSLFWQHEFLNESTAITSGFKGIPSEKFSVQTTEGDRDNALVGFGLDAEINRTITLFISYNAEAGGESYFGQSATGGVKIAF